MSKIPFLDPAWLKAGLVDTSGDAGSSGQILSSTGSGVNWVDQADIAAGETDKALSLTLRVKNTESVALTKGQVVCAAPTATPPSGNVIEVKLADNNGTDSMPAIGILNEGLDAAGGANDEGEAIMFGRISGIDTSAFSVGDEVFVSDTAGALTATKPTGVKYIQKVGVIMRDDASNGTIEVFGAGRTNDVPTPLYIDHANQRVGIGEENPDYTLEVNSGQTNVISAFKSSDNQAWISIQDDDSGTYGALIGTDSNAGNDFVIANSAAQKRFVINDGNVGIFTDSPNERLTIVGDDSKAKLELLVTGNTGSSQIHFGDDDDVNSGRIVYDHTSDFMSFYTNNVSDRMIIDSNGNVGIGTTSPGAKLEVNGNIAINAGQKIQLSGSADSTHYIYHDSTTDYDKINYSSGFQLEHYLNGAQMTLVGSSGNVGIGTTSPQQKLQVASPSATSVVLGASYLSTNNNNFFEVGINANDGYLNLKNSGVSTTVHIDSDGDSYFNGGNVGIGTTAPYGKLHVFDSATGAAGMTVHNNLEASGNSAALWFKVAGSSSDYRKGAILFVNNGTGYGRGDFYFASNTSTSSSSIASTSDTKMVIKSSGNVGIGTTSPNAKLQFDNGVDTRKIVLYQTANNDYQFYGFGIESQTLVYSTLSQADDHVFYAGLSSTSRREIMRIGGDGNVGIGTTSPGATLEVAKGSEGDYLIIGGDNASNARALIFSSSTAISNGALHTINAQSGNGQIAFKTGGTEALRIDSSQNVGIGTTSPSGKLEVNTGSSVAYFTRTAGDDGLLNPVVAIAADSSRGLIAASGDSLSFRVRAIGTSNPFGGNTVMSLLPSGNVGIGTTDPQEALHVDGNILVDSVLLSNQENTDVDSAAAEMVAQVAIATYTAVFFDFVIKKGTNVRSGTVYACHDGTNVEFTETSTQDLGDTSDVTLSVDISSNNIRLVATVTSDDWSIKTLVRAI